MKTEILIIITILLTVGQTFGQAINDEGNSAALVSGGLPVGTKAPELKVSEWLSEVPELEGKFIALDFWGPSCKPCIAGFPHINELHHKFKDEVVFIAATTADSPEEVYTFEAGTPVEFYSMMQESKAWSEDYKIFGIPHLILIDPAGFVRFNDNGFNLSEAILKDIIKQHGNGKRMVGEGESAGSSNLRFEGQLTGLTANTKVILSDMMGERFHDTATVKNNSFHFDRKLPGAGTYVLRVGLVGQKPENRVFYLDAGNVFLKGERGNLKTAKLSGDQPYMKDWLVLDSLVINDPIFALHKRQNDTVIMLAATTGSYDGLMADTAFVKRSSAVYPQVAARKIELAKAWLSEHPQSDINAYVIHQYLQRRLEENELKNALDMLSPRARNSLIGKRLKNSLDR